MELLPSAGLTLEYSLTVAVNGTTQQATEPGDGTFVLIGCVKDVPNAGNVSQDMSEHKCLDATETFIQKFPTGFLKSEDTTVKIGFAKAIYNTLEGLVVAGTQVCIRLKYSKLPSETTPSKGVRNCYIEKISDMVKGDGTEVEADFTLCWTTLPKFTAGT